MNSIIPLRYYNYIESYKDPEYYGNRNYNTGFEDGIRAAIDMYMRLERQRQNKMSKNSTIRK